MNESLLRQHSIPDGGNRYVSKRIRIQNSLHLVVPNIFVSYQLYDLQKNSRNQACEIF